MTNYIHGPNIEEKWWKMTIAQQMGNIGSEVSRAGLAQGKNQKSFDNAVARGLELIDLTLSDPRWFKMRGRLLEIARIREVFCDAIFDGKEFGSTFKGIQRYFDIFALQAMKHVGH